MEKDPHGKSPKEAGAKLDHGKNRLGLVLGAFSRSLQAVGEVGTYGANKYTDDGWIAVPDALSRYTDALYRHLMKEAEGQQLDPESQLLHAAHAAWNALARLDLLLRENDNKPFTVIPDAYTYLQKMINRSDAVREGNWITDGDWDSIKYTAEDLWTGGDWQSISRSMLGDWYAHETTDASDPGAKFPNQAHVRAIIAQLMPDLPDDNSEQIVITRPDRLQPKDDWRPWNAYPEINWVARNARGSWFGFIEKPELRDNCWVALSPGVRIKDKLNIIKWAEREHDILPSDHWKQTLIGKGDQL